jgi:hypothetical protein
VTEWRLVDSLSGRQSRDPLILTRLDTLPRKHGADDLDQATATAIE